MEGETDRQRDRDRISDKGYQGQELVGEHLGGEDMEEGENHQDEEEESDKQDIVLGPDSERPRRKSEPKPSPIISSPET